MLFLFGGLLRLNASRNKRSVDRLVVKFGGTSLADGTSISHAADSVIKKAKKGLQITVVVSAMGKTTDLLIDTASFACGKAISKDELDKAKNKILSALVLRNEVPMGRLVTVGFNWVYLKKYRTTHQDVEDVKSVTVEDINTLIRELKPGDFTQYSLGPAK